MADGIEPETFILCKEFLEETIDPDFGLLDKLLCNNTLSQREIREIKGQHLFHMRNSILLQYIIDKKKYDCLITALKDTNQVHIVNYLTAKGEYKTEEVGDEWPLREKKELSILDTNHGVLLDLIEPVELVRQLYSRGVISIRQRDAISSKLAPFEKNEVVLEILRRGSLKDFKITIECLRKSNQYHIAKILEQGGVVVKAHAEGLDDITEDEIIAAFERMLIKNKTPEERRRILDAVGLNVIGAKKGESIVLYVYCKTVIQIIQLKEMHIKGKLRTLVQRLFEKLLAPLQNVNVTVENPQSPVESPVKRQRLDLQHRHSQFDVKMRVENPQIPVGLMRDLQLCRSKVDTLTVTLLEDQYERCRSYFTAGLKLRAVFDFDPKVISEQQEFELKKILKSKAIDLEDKGDTSSELKSNANKHGTSEEHLDPYKMTLSFKKGNLMETILPEDIGDTTTWWRAIHLESEQIGYVPRRFVIIDYQMDFDQKYQTSPATSRPKYLKSATSNTSMSNLPLELLDSILQSSYLQHVLWEEQFLKNKDYHTISQMASVDCCWFQRIRRRKFRNEVWRSLFVYYRRKEKLSSIYRINRQYLEENIRLQGLVNQLKSIDCLTDVQAASLYRQNLPLGKKNSFKRFKDLTSEVVKRTEAIHSVFRRCLSDTKQHPIAEVIENGGAMTKVEIKLQKAKTSIKTRLLIAERINEMREKMKIPRSHQIVELMSKQKEDDVEIFNVGQDGDVIIVWIWCKTKHDLEKLQTLNKSKHIIDVLTEVVKNLSSSSEEPMIIRKVNTDFQQFKKRVVFFSIVANFTSRLKTEDESTKKDEEYVVGVTKLRNKIHIILNRSSSVPRCVILVFEDEIPFRLQKRIEIEEIEFPLDITSIEMENSLYVLDLGRRECVWKIKEEGDEEEEKEEIIRWLELRDYYSVQPKTLSVTRDGQLLLVGRRKNDPWWSLRIFGGSEKGDLRLSISLPEDIQWPYHAVETSKGNFIISHEIMRKKEKERGSAGGTRQMEKEMEEEKKEELFVVSKVSGDGETIIRRFIPQNEEQKLNSFDSHLAVDSFGRVFLTDRWNARVILFDSDLQWNGILIPTKEDGKEGRRIRRPWRLFYDEEKKELIVGGREEVFIYTLNRK